MSRLDLLSEYVRNNCPEATVSPWGARMTTEQTRAMLADEAGLRAAFEAVRVHSLGYVGEDYRLAADQTLAGMVEMYGRFDHGMKRLIDRAYQGLSPLNP